MKPGRFFSELRRRHVLRVVGGYAVAAWLVVEAYTTIQPMLLEGLEWTSRAVVVLALLGLPAAFVLSWVFDITPDGLRRTEPLPEPVALDDRAAAPDRRREMPAPRRRFELSARATGFFGLGILVALVSFAAWAGLREERRPGIAAGAPIESIAVLPFVDMSPAQDQEFFSDGVTEELMNRLAQLPELRVAARTSSFAFRGQNRGIDEIGRRLGVQAVLEGSVRRDGDRLRISATLIDAATGYRVWTQSFDGTAHELFALQDEFANAVVDALRHRLAATPEAGRRGTASMAAYEEYVKGTKRWHMRGDHDLRSALRHFLGAVRHDPDFALAHAALAQTYAVLPVYGAFPADSAVREGSAAAAYALSLDPSLAEAYAAMGQIVQNFEWDFVGAEGYYRRALAYQPGNTTAHQWYAETLLLRGRIDEAAAHVERVIAADPLAPTSLYVEAFHRLLSGDVDGSLAGWRELVRLHPQFEPGVTQHIYTAAAAGRAEEAARSLERLAQLQPLHAALYGAVARAVLDPAAVPEARLTLARTTGMRLSDRAALHMVLADRAGALAAVEQAFHQHTDPNLPFVLVHPLLAPLRGEARFDHVITSLDLGTAGPSSVAAAR